MVSHILGRLLRLADEGEEREYWVLAHDRSFHIYLNMFYNLIFLYLLLIIILILINFFLLLQIIYYFRFILLNSLVLGVRGY